MSDRHLFRLAERGFLAILRKGGEGSRSVVPKASLEKYLRSLEVSP
jgi:hypothetical protein